MRLIQVYYMVVAVERTFGVCVKLNHLELHKPSSCRYVSCLTGVQGHRTAIASPNKRSQHYLLSWKGQHFMLTLSI